MELRPYQQQAVDAVLSEWNMGHRKTLLVLPTGGGKTICFAKAIERKMAPGEKALILAHRSELLSQAADKLYAATGLTASLEKAESTALGKDDPVVVGSVQTMSMPIRLSRFPENYFSTIVVDEAHHVMSDSYKRILEHFPKADVLGVTATPNRSDQKSLGAFFDSKAFEYTLPQAIMEGYLCPIKAMMIPLALDISHVGLSNGDYAAGEIGSALEPYLEEISREMKKHCKGKKTVVFLPLVDTSKRFCALLKKQGFLAEEVNGESSNREEILRRFEKGETEVLCNAMLLTEGWDCPGVDCIVVLRPTRSQSLYQQMVGRGTRLSPGKEHLLLLDFLWLTERHDLCKPSSLISKTKTNAAFVDDLIEKGEEVDLMDAEEMAEDDAVKEREKTLATELALMRQRKLKLVDPIQYAFSIAAEDLAEYEPTFAWEMGPATEKQLEYLEKCGIFPGQITSCGMASLLIDKLKRRRDMGLATPKQIRFLERYGFYRVGTWSFDDAGRMISRISENHWSIPSGVNPSVYIPNSKGR